MANIDKSLRRAEKAVATSNWAEAAKHYLQVVEVSEYPEALLFLSYSESNAGNYRLARTYALRAEAARPRLRSPVLVLRLLSRLRHFNETDALRRFITGSPFLREMDPKVLQAVSAQLSYIGEQEQAAQLLDQAVAMRPDVHELLLARAQINVFLG
ncbi:MAG TPA: hypothetical protein VIT22_08460, partial [Pseudoxanthomonas sp.]